VLQHLEKNVRKNFLRYQDTFLLMNKELGDEQVHHTYITFFEKKQVSKTVPCLIRNKSLL
jgi:hypothetical protein